VSIYERGRIYWYKFMWNGEMVRESSRQPNQNKARQMEAAHRTSLAKGEVGIRDRKEIPTLKNFCIERVEPWAKSTFEQASHKTWLWYGFRIDSLKKSSTLANLKMNEIGPELVAAYAHRNGAATVSRSAPSIAVCGHYGGSYALLWSGAYSKPRPRLSSLLESTAANE
jgi:hypothetical protein